MSVRRRLFARLTAPARPSASGRFRRPNRALAAIAGAIGLALIGGCGAAPPASPTASPGVALTLQVLVRDGSIRAIGAECAGARPFLYIHAGGPFRVEDAATSAPALVGVLPAGSAIPALDDDLEVPRVPTFCLFSWDVVLPPLDRYRLVLEEGAPEMFSAADVDAENRITIALP